MARQHPRLADFSEIVPRPFRYINHGWLHKTKLGGNSDNQEPKKALEPKIRREEVELIEGLYPKGPETAPNYYNDSTEMVKGLTPLNLTETLPGLIKSVVDAIFVVLKFMDSAT